MSALATPELERLRRGAGEAPAPPDLVSVTATCPSGSAGDVLQRVRAVLEPIAEAPKPWPSPDEWRQRLPQWFVEATSDDERVTTCVVDKWSLRAWIWWFQPDQRRWLWWDAAVDGDRLRIRLAPTGTGSLLLGALDFLLKAAGATSSESV